MKIVKAEVLSSTPIRISRAASILSKFASAENGASQAVGAYIRRASEAFNELSQLHKENKSSSSTSHRKYHRDYETEDIGGEENSTRAPKQSLTEPKPEKLIQDPSRDGEEIERKRHKKKSEERAKAVEPTPLRNGVDGNIDAAGGNGKKKHKKRRKEKGDVGNSEETGDGKGFENGKMETGAKFGTNEVEAKDRKKRKNVEVEGGGEIGSEEMRSNKKKRRKIGDGDDTV